MYYPLVVFSSVLCAAPAVAGYPSPSLSPSPLSYPSYHQNPFPSLYHLEALSPQTLYHLALSPPGCHLYPSSNSLLPGPLSFWLPPVPLYSLALSPPGCHPYPSSSLLPGPLSSWLHATCNLFLSTPSPSLLQTATCTPLLPYYLVFSYWLPPVPFFFPTTCPLSSWLPLVLFFLSTPSPSRHVRCPYPSLPHFFS